MENGVCKKCSFQLMNKLAALYQVPATDLLDDYGRFLHDGQRPQIKALRESKGMTIAQFAEHLGGVCQHCPEMGEGSGQNNPAYVGQAWVPKINQRSYK